MGDKKSKVGSRFEAPQKKADTTAHYISPPALLASGSLASWLFLSGRPFSGDETSF
jgi:hypothetical protein